MILYFKTLVIYVVLATVVHSWTAPNRNSVCKTNYGLIPHPTNCRLFYLCAHGHGCIMECHKGTHFHPKLKVCAWPSLVKCSKKGSNMTMLPVRRCSGSTEQSDEDMITNEVVPHPSHLPRPTTGKPPPTTVTPHSPSIVSSLPVSPAHGRPLVFPPASSKPPSHGRPPIHPPVIPPPRPTPPPYERPPIHPPILPPSPAPGQQIVFPSSKPSTKPKPTPPYPNPPSSERPPIHPPILPPSPSTPPPHERPPIHPPILPPSPSTPPPHERPPIHPPVLPPSPSPGHQIVFPSTKPSTIPYPTPPYPNLPSSERPPIHPPILPPSPSTPPPHERPPIHPPILPPAPSTPPPHERPPIHPPILPPSPSTPAPHERPPIHPPILPPSPSTPAPHERPPIHPPVLPPAEGSSNCNCCRECCKKCHNPDYMPHPDVNQQASQNMSSLTYPIPSDLVDAIIDIAKDLIKSKDKINMLHKLNETVGKDKFISKYPSGQTPLLLIFRNPQDGHLELLADIVNEIT